MTIRKQLKADFLATIGWENTQVSPLAGDASTRQYQRLTNLKTGQTAILMDAPPKSAGSMMPFVDVAEYLQAANLSAPSIIAQDLAEGFLLLEDLGDRLLTNVITKTPSSAARLYETAVQVIFHLHDHPNPDLPLYDAKAMAQATDLAFLHYCHAPTGKLDDESLSVMDRFSDHLSQLGSFDSVSLRDFHAENLIWLPERRGLMRVGLLDFQDAVQTHPAYDLMSLLRDARRDVPPEIVDQMITAFCRNRHYSEDTFRAEAALISAQRNLRILGIFARLSRHMGKRHYVDLIPRVWNNLQTDLSHPSLDDLRKKLNAILPEPEPDVLNHLRTPCQTPQ